MIVHAYKSHEVIAINRRVWVTGLCGERTPLSAVDGEDIVLAISANCLRMFDHDPDKVTCFVCRRSKEFPLLELSHLDL